METRVVDAERERDELAAALDRYGWHKENCSANPDRPWYNGTCNCGWSSVDFRAILAAHDAAKDVEIARLRVLADVLDAVMNDEALKAHDAALVKPLVDALEELIEVADLRGDSELPHPANDAKLWTARMQSAWDNARDALAPYKTGCMGGKKMHD